MIIIIIRSPRELYRNVGTLVLPRLPPLRYNSPGRLYHGLGHFHCDTFPQGDCIMDWATATAIQPSRGMVSWLGPPPLQYKSARELYHGWAHSPFLDRPHCDTTPQGNCNVAWATSITIQFSKKIVSFLGPPHCDTTPPGNCILARATYTATR
jgi:hypothetical protein